MTAPLPNVRSDTRLHEPLPTVLYTLGILEIGGANFRSLDLLAELRRIYPDLPIHLYIQSQKRQPLDLRFAEAGMDLIYGYTGLKAIGHFWRTCRRVRPTIVHTSVCTTAGFFLLIAFLLGARVRICHFRSTGDWQTGLSAWLKRLIARYLIQIFSTHLVGVSDATRVRVNTSDAKWRTVYNGVPLDTAAADGGDLAVRARKRILVLGRISPEKNYLRPIKVLDALRRDFPDVPVVLDYVGPGPAEDCARLHEAIQASPCAASIVVSGPSFDPLAHMREADLLLLTSTIEGLPGVVLEALSVGTPVLSSDLPGTREIRAHVEGVVLVPLEADDRDWAAAAAEALARPRRARIKASFARGPFRIEDHVDAFKQLWGLPPAAGIRADRSSQSRAQPRRIVAKE
jgi:glycosyltransferase involved in cell wall biosynthesis